MMCLTDSTKDEGINMKLTKKELIKRLMNGEKLYTTEYSVPHYCYYDESEDEPFIYVGINNNSKQKMKAIWKETEWEIYKETPKYWEPENGEEAYYISICGYVYSSIEWDSVEDKNVIYQGHTFKTEEEAEKERDLRAAKYRVKKRIWELNGGEFIVHNENVSNWSFDIYKDIIQVNSWRTKFYPSWQYLKSEELVEQLISEMEEDLLLIRRK